MRVSESSHRFFTADGRATTKTGIWSPHALMRMMKYWGAQESEAGRPELWLPVALASGIVVYFALPFEVAPWLAPILLIVLVAALVAAMRFRHQTMTAAAAVMVTILIIAVTMVLGFQVAQWRTLRIAAPVLSTTLWNVTITGHVIAVTMRSDHRHALTLKPQTILDYPDDKLPRRIIITIRSDDPPPAGAFVKLRATVYPPPQAVMPGAFDYVRKAWFMGVGGNGYGVGKVHELKPVEKLSINQRLSAAIHRMRQNAADHIATRLDGDHAGIAIALLTGFRGAIDPDTMQVVRNSGLAHLLAISGLHMGMVAGVSFFIVRLILALSPRLTFHHENRKTAAIAAAMATIGYLLLSGGSAASLRATFMVLLVLIAVLLDRFSLTMRAIAIAAMLLLLFQPDYILEPGFRMSFAATIGLVAFFESRWFAAAAPFHKRSKSLPLAFVLISSAGRRLFLACAISLIATLATLPFAIFHFNRIAVYGALANLVAVPLTALVALPAGLLGLALIPTGYDAPAFTLMGWALDGIIAVAYRVSALPYAVIPSRSMSVGALCVISLGGLWFCLWSQPWRWAGILLIPLGLLLFPAIPPPDLIVGRDGRNLALRGDDGLLYLHNSKRSRYAAEKWLQRDGDQRQRHEAQSKHFDCDAYGCTATLRNGDLLAYAQDPEAFAEDCHHADILVTRYRITQSCPVPRVIIDAAALARDGAHMLIQTAPSGSSPGMLITTRQWRGQRPWSPKP